MVRLGTIVNLLYRALFPYRSHLEDEIVYLRAQLARADRRIDELEGKITPIPLPRRPAPKLPTLKQAVDFQTMKQRSREETRDEHPVQA